MLSPVVAGHVLVWHMHECIDMWLIIIHGNMALAIRSSLRLVTQINNLYEVWRCTISGGESILSNSVQFLGE